MKLRTYQAYSMAEALAAVKRDLGSDAIILNTRSFKRGGLLGLARRTVIELTATSGDQPAPRSAATAPKRTPPRVREPGVAPNAGASGPPAAQIGEPDAVARPPALTPNEPNG